MNPELKTEKDYQELARLGKVLGVPVFEAFLTLETFDKNGKQTSYHKQRSHSWTRNAYNHLFSQLAGKDTSDSTFVAGKLSMKITGGTIRYGAFPSLVGCINEGSNDPYSVDAVSTNNGGYRGPAGNDNYGIQVGTGTNAESFEDYVLQTKVATGNGATQLAYGEQQAHSVAYTSGTKTLANDLVRYFNNNSGGTIAVTEVALVFDGHVGGVEDQYVLVARDKLGAAVEVADTGQLKVTYTISLVFAG